MRERGSGRGGSGSARNALLAAVVVCATVDLTGKSVLLTGATGGLGRSIAGALAERGSRLILSSRKPDELEALAGELHGQGHRWIECDLAEPGGVQSLLGEVGEVDVVVANAGLPGTGKLEDFSDQDVRRALRVNLEAPIELARALLPGMRGRGRGHLVFVSSLAGKAASPRSSIYNATKFGLRGFALALQADLGQGPVGASLVSPGFVREAGMFHDSGAKPPPGMGTARPEQVADAVIEAIERNRVEIAVAPLAQRSIAHLGLAMPRLSLKAQSGKAGQRAAESVASGQSEKR